MRSVMSRKGQTAPNATNLAEVAPPAVSSPFVEPWSSMVIPPTADSDTEGFGSQNAGYGINTKNKQLGKRKSYKISQCLREIDPKSAISDKLTP